MKKIVLFVLLDQYADWEAAYLSSLLLALGQDDYAVKTVSLTRDGVLSLGGFTVLPDYDVSSVPEEFEGLALIGGMSWRTGEARRMEALVRHALSRGKVVGAICDATVFLGSMGALNTVRHTGNDVDDLKRTAGAAYTGEETYIPQAAVRDGRVVTANGTAALEFAREMLLALNVAPESRVMEWYRFYKLGPYQAPMPGL